MDMAAALADLGVTRTSIDAGTRDRLDRDGPEPQRPASPRAALLLRPPQPGQQLDQKKYIRPGTLARLSPAARFILDV
jgi:hypothetical protein